MTSRLLTTAAALPIAAAGFAGAAAARTRFASSAPRPCSPSPLPWPSASAQKAGFPAPVVESTGTGGGIKLFCEGVGENTPDIANASRRIKDSELEACKTAGVTPVEVKIGFDGIVLASAKSGPTFAITREQIFKALAKNLPDASGALQPNPNLNWSDIDPSLPAEKIEVLGPPPTSGTRDAFVELVMTEACAMPSRKPTRRPAPRSARTAPTSRPARTTI